MRNTSIIASLVGEAARLRSTKAVTQLAFNDPEWGGSRSGRGAISEWVLISVAATLLLFAAGGGRAAAATDFCAANLTDLRAVSIVDAGAASYTYRLVAFASETVDATMIADTDHGWQQWKVEGLHLSDGQRLVHEEAFESGHTHHPAINMPFTVKQSTTLGLTFPSAVRILRAWVTAANGHPCEPPSFGSGELAEWTFGEAMTPPSQVTTTSAATPSIAPFDATCLQPFVDVTAKNLIGPNLTAQARETIDRDGPEVLALAVAVSPTGKVLDVWQLAQIGQVEDFDRTSASAAKSSTYNGAISYCHPVSSLYLFVTSALPD